MHEAISIDLNLLKKYVCIYMYAVYQIKFRLLSYDGWT